MTMSDSRNTMTLSHGSSRRALLKGVAECGAGAVLAHSGAPAFAQGPAGKVTIPNPFAELPPDGVAYRRVDSMDAGAILRKRVVHIGSGVPNRIVACPFVGNHGINAHPGIQFRHLMSRTDGWGHEQTA